MKQIVNKAYRIRITGAGKTIQTCMPKLIVERVARREKMTLEKFVATHKILWKLNRWGRPIIRFITYNGVRELKKE